MYFLNLQEDKAGQMTGKQKSLLGVLLLLAMCFGENPRQQGGAAKPQQNPETGADSALAFVKDKDGKAMQMDFSLELKSVSDPDLLFSHFTDKNLLIFYFSVKCVHCEKIVPQFQALSQSLQSSGVSAIAIAVKNNSEDDIRDFIRVNNFSMPFFHDTNRKFSAYCGTGLVPLVIVVNSRGEYLRYSHFEDKMVFQEIKALFSSKAFH